MKKNIIPQQKVNLIVEVKRRDGFIRRIHLKESYIVGVLGIQRRVLLESIDDIAFQERILREHLMLEGWWDSTKKMVGMGVDEINKNFTNLQDVIKKMGNNTKAIFGTKFYISLIGY